MSDNPLVCFSGSGPGFQGETDWHAMPAAAEDGALNDPGLLRVEKGRANEGRRLYG